MVEEKKKYGKGTLEWLREQAKKNGFDNIPEWNKWKKDQKWYKELSNKYGKKFADWAIQNRYEVRECVINSGCKTEYEYQNKCAKKIGYKNQAERVRDYNRERCYNLGIYGPASDNKDCASWFGNISENYVMKTFEDPIPMPPNNPGFDWLCKKGEKIDHKSSCLNFHNTNPDWIFSIRYNNIADWFILSGWDNRDSLQPMRVWIFHKNDIVRGYKFWRRDSFSITSTLYHLEEFEKYEITNKLEKLKMIVQSNKI